MAVKKVLIIDDESDLVMMVRVCLRSAGFIVEVAYDGVSGLKKAESFQPDFVLLDLLMPEMDGWEVYQQLCANPKTSHVPVIIMTALLPMDDPKSIALKGARHMLIKPFKEEDLLKVLKS